MAYQAIHYGARISPTKVRPVINMIRGKNLEQAVSLLALSKKRAARYILVVLNSARANADQAEADVRKLVVSTAFVDGGPTMKRFQPKDRGRAHPILKRFSHIIVVVDEAQTGA